MAGIAKAHSRTDSPEWPAGHPVRDRWLDPHSGLLARLHAAMAARAAHPSRTLVLVPYAQLMPVAAQLWAEWTAARARAGAAPAAAFLPRFESLRNWARTLGGFEPAPGDWSGEAGRDLLTAQGLLEQAGLKALRDTLAPMLVEAASQIAPLAAAQPPDARAAWSATLGPQIGFVTGGDVLAVEAAVARIALAWVAASGFETDVLLAPGADAGLDAVVVLQGLQPEPVLATLLARWGERAMVLELAADHAMSASPALHAATDAEDEAQRATACVLRHIEAGRWPVALVANDRELSRRVRAQLAAQRIAVRDETGWKLSTTRVAANLMALLRAAVRQAGSDAVLDWLKQAPAFDAAGLRQLERRLRQDGARDWQRWVSAQSDDHRPAIADPAEAIRGALQAPRPLALWLTALREALEASGQWAALNADAAGLAVVDALHLEAADAAAFTAAQGERATRGRLSLAGFTGWCDAVLESVAYKPTHPLREQVVLLPLSQLLGRPFQAVVLPGADERHLSASPDPADRWTPPQREALGLPDREALARVQRRAWQQALLAPAVDVLWRTGDAGGETVLPSPLVQQLPHVRAALQRTASPLAVREVEPAPVARPLPNGAALPVAKLSASAYDDLRRCPYKFFALRQLGLQQADELEAEVDKRDVGLWLHDVLSRFHLALAEVGEADPDARRLLADVAARQATEALHLAPGEFMPFEAGWPRLRDGYLHWLAQHESGGACFEEAEAWREAPAGSVTLVGRLDRIDRQAGEGGAVPYLIDYKTESAQKTKDRLKRPLEDTQLAFYAALTPGDAPRAAYVNVGERDGTHAYPMHGVAELRDRLLAGITDDMARIAAGVPLPALGDGAVCDFCAARGLCRKDFVA